MAISFLEVALGKGISDQEKNKNKKNKTKKLSNSWVENKQWEKALGPPSVTGQGSEGLRGLTGHSL